MAGVSTLLAQLPVVGNLSVTNVPPDPVPVSPVIQFASVVPLAPVPEAAGFVEVGLIRTGDLTGTATVRVATSGGSAVAQVDYVGIDRVIVFNPGVSLQTILIEVLDDPDFEVSEWFNLRLTEPTGAVLGAPSELPVWIEDLDVDLPSPGADLELGVSVPTGDYPTGQPVPVAIQLTNGGPGAATNVVVECLLSPGLTWEPVAGGPDPNPDFNRLSGTWQLALLLPGESRTLQLAVQAASAGPAEIAVEVAASGAPDPDSTPGNGNPAEDDRAAVFVNFMAPASADLQLFKFADPEIVGAGQVLRFFIRVANNGPDEAKGIVVKDTLAPGVVLKEAKPAKDTTFDDKKMEWTVPALASGKFVELELATTAMKALSFTNTAEITATQVPDPQAGNNQASAPARWVLYSVCGTVKLCHFFNGAPHTNAIVELRQAGNKLQDTRSDLQGAFCFKDVAPGKYQVIARPADPASGIQDSMPEEVELGEGNPGGAVKLQSPWPVIQGRLTLGIGGPPIPDVELKLAGNGVNKTTKTDKAGLYRFTGLADGEYTVTPTPPEKGGTFAPVSAKLKMESCGIDTNFVFKGNRTIQGRVVTCDPQPSPVPFATVILSNESFPSIRSVVTGPDGSFRFTNLVYGKFNLDAQHPAYDFTQVQVETVNPVTSRSLTGTPKAGTIYARVIDSLGAGVPDIEVAFFPPGANQATGKQRTDANGSVVFRNVANGRWAVQPQAPDNRFTFKPGTDFVSVGIPKVCRNHALFTASLNVAELVAIEVVQVIQDWRNSMPLVEGKQTLVRAFFRPPGTNRAPVTLRDVRLRIDRPGEKSVTLNAGRSVVANGDYATKREIPATSLPFDITKFTKGSVTLTIEWPSGVLVASPEAVAAGALKADKSATANFTPPPPLGLKWVLLDWKFKDKKDAATPAVIARHRDRLLAALPVTSLPAGPKETTVLKWIPGRDPTVDDPDEVVRNTLELYDLVTEKRLRDEPKGSKAIYYTLIQGVVFRDNSPIPGDFVLIRSQLDKPLYRNRPAHELGHALGRHHAVHTAYGVSFGEAGPLKHGACDEIAGGGAPDFPMDYLGSDPLQPTLGPMRMGDYRLAFGWDHTDGTYVSPRKTADLMSYCSFGTDWTWPGLYSYVNLHNALVNRFGKGGAAAPTMPGADSPCLLISGWIEPAAGRVELDPVDWTLYPRTPEFPPTGGYVLRVLDSAGGELFSAPFAAQFDFDADPAPIHSSRGRFRFCLPDLGAVAAIEIWADGKLLHRAASSAAPPALQIVSPVDGAIAGEGFLLEWTADDSDGDPLWYTIERSVDGGATWETVANRMQENSIEMPRDGAGGELRLRVTASDGFHRTAAEVALKVLAAAPVVEVLDPLPGSVVNGVEPLRLRAAAYGAVEFDGSAQWESDREGALGTGSELVLEPHRLSPGSHVLTVRGRSESGLVGTASAGIVVADGTQSGLTVGMDLEEVELSWPADSGGMVLSGSTEFDSGRWFPILAEPYELEGRLHIRLPATDEPQYFRLELP